jgi:hypothetical protein
LRALSVGRITNASIRLTAASSVFVTVSTAIALATSPAAWPPMPSATTKNRLAGSTYTESSL